MNTRIITILFFIFTLIVLALTLRGIPGTPTHESLNTPEWKDEGPLELSPDRGRFALMYSLIEDRSFHFSLPVARFTTPDVAYLNGNYVSLFAPGLSFLIMPGYVIGKYFGAGQVGAFAVVALFAFLNVVLLRAIAIRLGANRIAANIGATIFLFATPAFTYSVTLYQHHISTFIILLAVWLLLRSDSLWSLALIWFLFAFSIVVDNPNIFLMLPIGFYALGKIVYLRRGNSRMFMYIRPVAILTFITAILPIFFFLWFNKESYGDPLQLPGTVRSVEAIDERGFPTASDITKKLNLVEKKDFDKKKVALNFFKTRNMLNGFYIHTISPDRGILWFTPVILVGIFGIIFLYVISPSLFNLFLSIIGFNVIVYSMWGDPYGGWAFGSRYLLPTYAILGIGIALVLTHVRKKYIILLFFALVAGYSVWVNALGALTSSRNPPQIEVLALEKVTNREEKYTYERNLQFLNTGKSKSFVFQTFGKKYMSASTFHNIITGMIISVLLFMLGRLFISSGEGVIYARRK